jgi:hypothetical protein
MLKAFDRYGQQVEVKTRILPYCPYITSKIFLLAQDAFVNVQFSLQFGKTIGDDRLVGFFIVEPAVSG